MRYLIRAHRTFTICLFFGVAALAAQSPPPSQPPDAPPPIVQPGAPGEPTRTVDAAAAADTSHVQATPADIAFMQGMIAHHSQAVDMVELLKTRTQSDDMRKLALRIELSQRDEIQMMRHWLEVRGQAAPAPHAMHGSGSMAGMSGMAGMDMGGGDMPLMPGMLTPPEMDRLAAAKGPEFDRLFLEGMIKHHGGALTMVADLFATPGAAQQSEIFSFASDVDSDQRMEIDRMSRMLAVLKEPHK